MKVILALIVLYSTQVFSKSYLQYEKNLKKLPYTIQKGDTLSTILYNSGYKNIYVNLKQNKSANPIHQTMWQNGIANKDLYKLKVGSIIYLPLKNHRGIASVDSLIDDIPTSEIERIVVEYTKSKEQE